MEGDADYAAVSDNVPRVARGRNEHDYRVARNCLPQVFFVYAPDLNEVVGSVLLVGVYHMIGHPQIYWHATWYVSLIAAVAITVIDCEFMVEIFRLTPKTESKLRTSPCRRCVLPTTEHPAFSIEIVQAA